MTEDQQIVAEYMRYFKNIILMRMNEHGIQDNDHIVERKIHYRTSTSSKTGNVSARVYIPVELWVMQRGRRPGKVPKGFTQMLEEWYSHKNFKITLADYWMEKGGAKRSSKKAKRMRKKFNSENQAIHSFAYFTGKKIAKEGSKLYREHGYRDIVDSAYTRVVEEMAQTFANRLQAQTTYKFARALQLNDNGEWSMQRVEGGGKLVSGLGVKIKK